MAATPYDVAEAFLAGKAKKRGAFRSTGLNLYSYNLLLAQQSPEAPHWVIDPRSGTKVQ